MKGNPVRGAGYLLKGASLLPQPGLRRFVIIPLLVNVLLFVGAIWLLVKQFDAWVGYWLGFIPNGSISCTGCSGRCLHWWYWSASITAFPLSPT